MHSHEGGVIANKCGTTVKDPTQMRGVCSSSLLLAHSSTV